MSDLNVMMREHALSGLNTQLDQAVTNGDTEAARKISGQIAQLTLQSAPKAPPYGDAEIRAALDKAPWFGIDPKKSGKAVEFGKTMDPKKFATAEAFAEAIIKAVDAEFPAPGAGGKGAPKGEEGEEDFDEVQPGDETDPPTGADGKPKKRATDGPREGELGGRGATNRRTGPWTKLGDAPADIQKEVRRQADKFVSASATKEQREKFISNALEGHYRAHQRKGRK